MLSIQDSKFTKSSTFHESLLSLTTGTIKGAGMFAFVTSSGVRLLLEDKSFESMIKDIQSYTLIIGIDQITNDKAIDALKQITDKYGDKLIVKAYYNTRKGVLFHPKFSWFKREENASLIIGSSNMTEGGLRRNIEGFLCSDYTLADFISFEATWDAWLKENDENLLSIDDERVIEKCKLNKKKHLMQKKIIKKLKKELNDDVPIESFEEISESIEDIEIKDISTPEEDDIEDVFSTWSFNNGSYVLLAEIPKSGDRWEQANFSKASFIKFFGATPGDNSQRILLRNVTDTTIGETEVRPSVSVKSKNYRFELNAAKGLNYPDEGRPIGIFIKLSVRQFFYTLIMPSDDFYDGVMDFMDSLETRRTRKLRRIESNVSALRRACSDLPFWRLG